MPSKKPSLMSEMQDELFKRDGKGWFRIVSGSMSPLIEINDRVFVKRVLPSEIKTGDIILFRSDEVFVTHRAVELSKQTGGTMVLQKGDASNHASWVPLNDIVGKVITIEKKGKFLNLTSWQGRVMNGFFGWKNCFSYQLGLRIDPVKQRLRGKPGFIFMRTLYRALKRPFRYAHRIMARIVFFPTFFR
jgi:signal peptidase I